jgi:large subunit ribosomal protein L24
MAGMKIRAGDTVEVITGKDAGRRGRVLEAMPTEGRVIVEGRNIAKKHSRPRPVRGSRGAQMTPGGVIDLEQAIEVSNVMLVCPSCNKPTRVGSGTLSDGTKIRMCKKCGGQIEDKHG